MKTFRTERSVSGENGLRTQHNKHAVVVEKSRDFESDALSLLMPWYGFTYFYLRRWCCQRRRRLRRVPPFRCWSCLARFAGYRYYCYVIKMRVAINEMEYSKRKQWRQITTIKTHRNYIHAVTKNVHRWLSKTTHARPLEIHRETNVVYYKRKTVGSVWDICNYFEESYSTADTERRLCVDPG